MSKADKVTPSDKDKDKDKSQLAESKSAAMATGAKDDQLDSRSEDSSVEGRAEPAVDDLAGKADGLKLDEWKAAATNQNRSTCLKPPRSLETTLFERLEHLYGPGIKRVLRIQYR